jgi:hypothetical protein
MHWHTHTHTHTHTYTPHITYLLCLQLPKLSLLPGQQATMCWLAKTLASPTSATDPDNLWSHHISTRLQHLAIICLDTWQQSILKTIAYCHPTTPTIT